MSGKSMFTETAMTTHKDMCKALGVPEFMDAPYWKSYAKKATRVVIQLEGYNGELSGRLVFGGAMSCKYCEFGIDIRPDGDSCPKCGRE